MRPIRPSPGFTLIELLTAVVIIGVIAAIVLVKFEDIKEKAYVAAMMNDVRNAIPIEAIHYDSTHSFASNPLAIPGYALSPDVVFIGGRTTATSWSGVVGHVRSHTICGVLYNEGDGAMTKINCDKSLTLPLGASSTNFSAGQTVTFDASTAMAQFAYGPGASSASLMAASPNDIVLVAWDFGDGFTVSGSPTVATSVQHTFRSNGSPRLALVKRSGEVKGGTTPGDIAPHVIFASFDVSPNPARATADVTMNAQSSKSVGGAITSYAWDFGDAASSAGVSVAHPYATPGTYLVSLTVTDDAGQTASASQEVDIAPADGRASPTAVIGASIASPMAGESDVLDGSASTAGQGGTIAAYAWDLGDGTTAATDTVTHAWATPATYTVVLTVTDDLGLTGQASQPFSVASSASSSGPVAAFHVDTLGTFYGSGGGLSRVSSGLRAAAFSGPLSRAAMASAAAQPTLNASALPLGPNNVPDHSCIQTQTLFLNAEGSTATPGASITAYAWNFGNTSVEYPTSSTPRVTPGALSADTVSVPISLQVTDNAGQTSAPATHVVCILAPTIDTTLVSDPNVPVDYTYSPMFPEAGFPVNFDGSAAQAIIEGPPGYHRSTPSWNFGDRSSGQYYQSTHSFPGAGQYKVRLLVTRDDGLKGFADKIIPVSPYDTTVRSGDIAMSLAITPAHPKAGGDPASFALTTNGCFAGSDGTGRIRWQYGDGQESLDDEYTTNEGHAYASVGVYSVVVEARSSDGKRCHARGIVHVVANVNLPPTAKISYLPSTPIVGQPLYLSSAGSTDEDGSIVSYSWNLTQSGVPVTVQTDAATGGTGGTAYFIPTSADTVTGTLTVTDDMGATGTATGVSPILSQDRQGSWATVFPGSHCGISTNGDAFCWGRTFGLSTYTSAGDPYAVPLATPTLVALSGSRLDHFNNLTNPTCAINNIGYGFCRGTNSFNEIGTGDANYRIPADVWTQDVSGVRFTERNGQCALSTDGGIYCSGHYTLSGSASVFGAQNQQEGPQGLTSNNFRRADFTGTFSHVYGGSTVVCGYHEALQDLYCWGIGDGGQTGTGGVGSPNPGYTLSGNPDYNVVVVPTLVQGGPWLQASVGQGLNSTSCAVDINSRIACWGSEKQGELGSPSRGAGPQSTVLSPVYIDDSQSIYTEVATGEGFNCGLTVGGNVNCWGDQYGATPAPAWVGLPFVHIYGVGGTMYGLMANGSLYVWGYSQMAGDLYDLQFIKQPLRMPDV